ncbi:4'-phosphopantetheinyl transferase superfamily protein [Pedobacter sp. L105]|uniref:4'-phosphopantetheinyl transferase family protein n=1 Tax=Pedobacter sp. L105 TaxID=1641871 RepID=UPI00131C620A|nr:4'-phosphopantetheinyl transferase superfamily protein [Pedobacter sp. L105]
MIGNDLVDLEQARLDSNWRREGYLAKIYTLKEQELILQSPSSDTTLWLLWTMKEACYKIVNRMTGVRQFSPLSFVCQDLLTDDIQATGRVRYKKHEYITRSTVSDQLIHSIAVSRITYFKNLKSHFLANDQAYLQKFNRLSTGYRLIKTTSGLPELIHSVTGNRHAVSVSHHGKYLAIVYSDSLLLTD